MKLRGEVRAVLVGSVVLAFCGATWAASAGQAKLVLSSPAFERDEPVAGELELGEPVATQGATMVTEVRDSFGRVLVQRSEPLPGDQATCRTVALRVAVPNVLVLRHWLGVAVRDAQGGVQYAQAPVIFRPPVGWDEYRVIMWQRHNAKRLPYLRKAHIDGGIWPGPSDMVPEPFVDANYRWYVEGSATPILSPYHRWFADHEVEYYFKLQKERVKADRGNLIHWQRSPCLSDPITREMLERMMMNPARQWHDYRPFWYSLSDEPGIGGQAAASDFCFAPACRDAFRDWLKQRYADVAALNGEWGTGFSRWEDVVGLTTDQVFARAGDNFSPWCDHTDFMDDVLMGAYRLGAETVRRFDPGAFVAIGGAQGPVAVGGWDWWKLCQVLDCMEPYYIGNNYELIRSFNPAMHLVSIEGGADDMARYQRWYLFVHGDHGAMLWDDKSTFVDDEGHYDERAQKCQQWLGELKAGVARQYMFAPRIDDPVAIYHSQATLRVHWVLHVRPIGQAWIDRFSFHERTDNPYSRVRESWIKLVEDAGLQYKMIASEQVRDGALKVYDPQTKEGFKLLILPRIIALSAQEVEAIRQFVQGGGTVIADGQIGLFDEHGKRLEAGRLDDLFGIRRPATYAIEEAGTVAAGIGELKVLEGNIEAAGGVARQGTVPAVMVTRQVGKGRCYYVNLDLMDYHRWRLHPAEEAAARKLLDPLLLEAVGADRRTPTVRTADGQVPVGVEATVKDLGAVRMVAVMRNLQLRINELGSPEYQSNDVLAAPIEVVVDANGPGQQRSFVYYDVRAGKRLGVGPSVKVQVPAFEPAVLSVWPEEAGAFSATAPERVAPGEPLAVAVKPGGAQANEYVYRVEVVGPDGSAHELYTRNWACDAKGGQVPIPLALNDPPGGWTVRLREVLTGSTQQVRFVLAGAGSSQQAATP